MGSNQTVFIMKRAVARRLGLKFYYTGRPCKRGHVAERYTSARTCAVCRSSTDAAWYADNIERQAANNAAWARANADRKAATSAAWSKANPDKVTANSAARRARKLQASSLLKYRTPEQQAKIQEIYTEAQNRPGDWHVDHIIPLQGKTVSGLHVHYNLQVLEASENISKSNSFDPSEHEDVNKIENFLDN